MSITSSSRLSCQHRLSKECSMRLTRFACLALILFPITGIGQTQAGGPMPPRTWVDKDTGHRVWRLSDEPNSGAFYFNVNGYTPDLKTMIYTAPDGIHTL